MKRMLVGAGLVAVLGLTGCIDSTEPTEVNEVRIAHVAPGAGGFTVARDGRILGTGVDAGQWAYYQVAVAPHTYSFENESLDLQVEVPSTPPVSAVLLMNAPDPELRAYGLEVDFNEQRLVVVNADTSTADLTIILEGDEDTYELTLERAESEMLSVETGSYDVLVHTGDPGEAVAVDDITLRATDHGFLVLYPGVGADRWQRLIF